MTAAIRSSEVSRNTLPEGQNGQIGVQGEPVVTNIFRWIKAMVRGKIFKTVEEVRESPEGGANTTDVPGICPEIPVENLGFFPYPGMRAPQTGPLELLAGHQVVVLCDVENLSYGAKSSGYNVSYRQLGQQLTEASASCELHAFFSCDPNEAEKAQYFWQRGWTPHVQWIETIPTYTGWRQRSNSDNLILLWAGWLAAQKKAEMYVLASGDGTLVCDIANFLVFKLPLCKVVTLSLPGSTSLRLRAEANPAISANLVLGEDVLRPRWYKVCHKGIYRWKEIPTPLERF